jgi:uncharacterized protein (DUF488 family)
MTGTPIFTIGHSTQSLEQLFELLKCHGIQYVIDVRSAPYSRWVPHFNKEPLAAWLRRHEVHYAHMPDEFGARKQDPALLDAQHRVDFERVRATPEFRSGIERLKRGSEQGHRIALMCAEADPYDCHRFSLISYQLVREGVAVKHILKDGDAIDNELLEQRLRDDFGITAQADLFGAAQTVEAQLDEAYRRRGRQVAYTSTEETE